MSRPMLAVLVLVVLAMGPPPAPAMEKKPLPAFRLSASDGTRVSSLALLGQQRWIVVYAAPGCRPCDDLLAALGRLEAQALSRRMLLVVGAPPDEAGAYVRRTLPRALSRLRWYADDQAEAWEGLQLGGAPMLVGIRDGHVEWGVSGTLNDLERLSGLLRSWLDD